MAEKDRNPLWHAPKDGPYPADAEDAAGMEAPPIRTEARVSGVDPGWSQAGASSIDGEETKGQNDYFHASMAARQLDRWLESMEKLRLAEYVRYVDDKKRLFWSSFLGGMARGVGMAVGFTILGAVLVLILQDLAKHNLPVIGDFLAQIVSVVQKRLE